MSAHLLYVWREFVFSPYGPPDPSTRLVLAAISLHINSKTGEAWPSQDRLVTETALSLSSIKRHLARAVDDGWLTRKFRHEDGKKYGHYVYVARCPESRKQELAEFKKIKEGKRNRALGYEGIPKEDIDLGDVELT